MLRRFVFNRRNTPAWIFLVILSWVSSIVAVLIPYVHQLMIDQLSGHNSRNFYVLLAALLGLYVFEIAEGYFYEYRKCCFQENVKKDLRLKINDHILHLKHSYFVDNGTEKIISRYSKDSITVSSFYGEMLIELLGNIVMLASVVFVITRVDYRILLLSLAVIVFYAVMTIFLGKRIKKEVKNFLKADEEALGVLSENCSKEILIKTYSLYEKCRKKYAEKYENAFLGRKRAALLSAANTSGARLILYILQGVVFIVAGIGVLNGRTTVGALISMIECQSFLLIPFFFFGQFNARYQEYVSSRERVEELLKEEPEIIVNEGQVACISKIDIKDLNFSYQTGKDVLKNINMSLEKGSITGIVGRSGIGKSTLINLLLGIYMPPEGSIYVDENDICGLSLTDLRKHIGYVPQESMFFNESLKENLFCDDPDTGKIERISKDIDIYDEIKEMENGPDTIVGVDGNTLSGGQKKRLDFLRVFCNDKDVLIFDEPTAMLDQKRRDLFYRYLMKIKEQKIIIVISHNDNEMTYFDHIHKMREDVIHE